jgi:hypothetical protein
MVQLVQLYELQAPRLPILPLLARIRAVVGGTPVSAASTAAPVAAAPGTNPKTEHTEVRSTTHSFVKVDTQQLDSLVDFVGEMVSVQSMVAADIGTAAGLAGSHQGEAAAVPARRARAEHRARRRGDYAQKAKLGKGPVVGSDRGDAALRHQQAGD